MGNKIIAVNWKWAEKISDYKEYLVAGCDDCSVYFTNFENGEGLSDYRKFISQIFESTGDQVLVLTHTSEPNNISKADLSEIKCGKNNRIENFGGGEDKIYSRKGGFLFASGDLSSFEDSLKKLTKKEILEELVKIPKSRFDGVWNWYWSQSVLDSQKRKLINIFLPLVMDIKGFDEVADIKSREKYHKEIVKAIGEYGNDIISGWNDIKTTLALKTGKNIKPEEVLSENYRITDKTRLYFSPLESEENPGFSLKNLIDLFTYSNKEERKKVIQWFIEIIDLLNKKIETKTGSVSPDL